MVRTREIKVLARIALATEHDDGTFFLSRCILLILRVTSAPSLFQVLRLERVTAGYVAMCSRRAYIQETLEETVEAKKAQAKVAVRVWADFSRGAVRWVCFPCRSFFLCGGFDVRIRSGLSVAPSLWRAPGNSCTSNTSFLLQPSPMWSMQPDYCGGFRECERRA